MIFFFLVCCRIVGISNRQFFLFPPPCGEGVASRAMRRVGDRLLANENARALRKRLTPQEVRLWAKLRELKGLGFHFRRQAPIGRYIVDFASFRFKLVVEADGGQHGRTEAINLDQVRDAFLRSQGFAVLRFWNSDIDSNLPGVMESILNALESRPPARARETAREYYGYSEEAPPDRPSAGHPPHKGEGDA